MENNNKLSVLQSIILLFGCRLGTIYISLPPLVSPPGNQDVWFVEIISYIYMVAVSLPLLFLVYKFKNKSLVEILEILCGKVLGKILGILYMAFLLFICILTSCHLIQFLGSAIMPETPPYSVIIFMLITCSIVAFKDIEAIGRLCELLIPIVSITILILILLNIKLMDFKTFLPILTDSSLSDISFGAFNISARFYEIIIFCMLIPNIKDHHSIKKIFNYFLITYLFFLLIMTISNQAVFGIEQSKHLKFPYYMFSREIDAFDFIQRIEIISIFGWFIVVFVKVTIYIYIISIGMKQICNAKNYKQFILPECIIIFIIAIYTPMSQSVIFAKSISYKLFPYISMPFIIIIPLFLLVLYFIRRKSFANN